MKTEKAEMDMLLDHLRQMIREGFENKHFEFTVSFQPQTKDKTSVQVTGGPSKQFVLRQGEIEP